MLGKLQVISGPRPQEKPWEEVSCRQLDPAWATFPFRWTLGKNSVSATPMRATSAARVRSASRTSGRRRSRLAPSPLGNSWSSRGGALQASASLEISSGASPVSTASS